MVTGSKSKLRDRVEAALSGFKEDPQSVGFHWRLNLSTLLCELLEDKKDWTQKRLAKEAEMSEQVVSRILNADSNCKFETAGRLLFALGIREGDIELLHSLNSTLRLSDTTVDTSTLSPFLTIQGNSPPAESRFEQLTGSAHGQAEIQINQS